MGKCIDILILLKNEDFTGGIADDSAKKRIAGYFINIVELTQNPQSECIFEIDTSYIKEMMSDKMLSSIWLNLGQ